MAAIMINSVIEDTIPAVSPALLDEDTIKVKITHVFGIQNTVDKYMGTNRKYSRLPKKFYKLNSYLLDLKVFQLDESWLYHIHFLSFY